MFACGLVADMVLTCQHLATIHIQGPVRYYYKCIDVLMWYRGIDNWETIFVFLENKYDVTHINPMRYYYTSIGVFL